MIKREIKMRAATDLAAGAIPDKLLRRWNFD